MTADQEQIGYTPLLLLPLQLDFAPRLSLKTSFALKKHSSVAQSALSLGRATYDEVAFLLVLMVMGLDNVSR